MKRTLNQTSESGRCTIARAFDAGPAWSGFPTLSPGPLWRSGLSRRAQSKRSEVRVIGICFAHPTGAPRTFKSPDDDPFLPLSARFALRNPRQPP